VAQMPQDLGIFSPRRSAPTITQRHLKQPFRRNQLAGK
jgi:hypothetical protein